MKLNFLLYFSFLILVTMISSCDPGMVYESNKDLNNNSWSTFDTLQFDFNVGDTSKWHDLYINIRNTPQYIYSNLYIFLKISAPNGNYSTDTIECVLADKKGKWLGNGTAGLLESKILYKKNIRFPVAGAYRMEYIQAMRVDVLSGISSMGFRLEHSENKKE